MNHTIEFDAPFGFSLAAAADFYAGFEPMGGAAGLRAGRLVLAFLLDRTFEPVGATLTQREGTLRLEVEGTNDVPAVRRQVTRMLGLEADGRAWTDLGRKDPLFGTLQQQWPGFFTAGFPSPWEAGFSGVLSHRSSVKQASVLRQRLSLRYGVPVAGLHTLPSPETVLAHPSLEGVPEQKHAVLRGLARAALEGALDAEHLRGMESARAVDQLQRIHGVGPWTATHMLVRGASTQDVVATTEPRVFRAFTAAYGRPERDFHAVASAWKPFRTWACIILVRHLARLGQWAAVPDDFRRRRAG